MWSQHDSLLTVRPERLGRAPAHDVAAAAPMARAGTRSAETSMIEAPTRYALYWVPPREHPLWLAGCAWLGRDPEFDAPGRAPAYATRPWRYGFHATLKAPLQLVPGRSEEDFLQLAAALAARTRAFTMPRLQVARLDNFLALRPAEAIDAAHPLQRLADDSVTQLEACRRPLAPDELQARLSTLGDAALRSHLERWGYPYVFERWRLHLTLSDARRADEAGLLAAARRHFAPALELPLQATSIAVFRQAGAGAAFSLLARLPLGA